MTSKAALLALFALWGVGSSAALPAYAEEARDAGEEASPAKRSFTNRVWVQTGSDDLPGNIRIFLSDGTLVQDSCWETHRLSPWKMTSSTGLSWNEDGMEIAAEIVSVTASDLVLSLKLGNEMIEQRFAAAAVPYVCPDMPKA
jgi:hypothetical protein